MDENVFPLAEVDLKVGDDAIKFENDEDKESINENNQLLGPEFYGDSEMMNNLNLIKQAENYEEVNFHFLSASNAKVDSKDPSRRFQCEFCGKYFNRKEHLKNHERTHTGERPFVCDCCKRSFAKNFDLTRHKQYVHSPVTTFFICEECGRTFSRKDHLKSHLITHKNRPLKIPDDGIEALIKTFTCETCGRTFCRPENLKKHMLKHIENIDCTNYDSKDIINNLKDEAIAKSIFRGINFHFMSANDIEPRVDTSLRPFPCEYCGRLFIRKDHLKNHERTHTGERPYQCEQCDRRFAKRFVMTRHLQNVHQVNTKIHKCSECDRKFARTDHLKTHMKIHILAAVRNQQKEKMHKCDVCDRQFTRSDNLKTHMKIHLLAAVRNQQEEVGEQRCLEHENLKNSDSEDANSYFCDLCRESYSNLEEFHRHEEKHKKSGAGS